MKLFHKTNKSEITDETLDHLLADAYDARLSGLSDNECRGKHRLSAVSAQEALTVGPHPIRAIPARYVRWQTAVAAALFLVLLGAGGWLLVQSLRFGYTPTSSHSVIDTNSPLTPDHSQLRAAPQNCRLADLGGRDVYVLNDPEGEYDGEYDLQQADKEESFFKVAMDAPLNQWLPEGFAQKTVMGYEEYAAYCASFDLEQKYDVPNQCYIIYAWALENPRDQAPSLADVTQSGNSVFVLLHNPGEDGIHNRSTNEAWVLVIPVSAETETLEVCDVLNETEYQYRKLLNQTTVEANAEGDVCITGIATDLLNYEFWLGSPAEKEYPAVWLQYEGTEIHVTADERTEWVNPDGTPFKKEAYQAFHNTPYGQAWPKICVVAENCQPVGSVIFVPRIYDNCYHAERIVIYFGDEAERILREAQHH